MEDLFDGTSPLLPGKRSDAASPIPEFNPYSECEQSDLGAMAADVRTPTAARARWRPSVLRPLVTVPTVLVLLGVIAGLEAFLRLSHNHSGFPVPSAGVQSVLTYGPVVAFVAFGMVWKSWEIEVKTLAPWTTMYQRPTPATNSILLDYIGADYVSVLYQAMVHRHWTVLLAIVGSAMFSVCTITATSLWELSSQVIVQPALLQQTTTLDTYFNDTGLGYVVPYIGGVIYHMPPPRWIHSGYVITPFQSSDAHDVAGLISARVAAYSATLVCEPVPMSDAGSTMIGLDTWMDRVRVSWRGCDHIVNVTRGYGSYYGRMIDLVCGPFRAGLITVFHFLPDRTEHNGTACSPVYTRAYPNIVVNASDHTIVSMSAAGLGSPERVDLPSGDGLLYWIYHSNSYTDHTLDYVDREQWTFLGPWPDALPLIVDPGPVPQFGTWINLLGRVRRVSTSDVMDPLRLGNISRDVFHDMFPYIAQAAYTQPTQKALSGERVLAIQRLVCRDASIRITQGALCVAVLIAIVLCFLHPSTHVTADPGSLLHAAVVLGTSAQLEKRLGGAGAMSALELCRQLQTVSCQTVDELGLSRPALRVFDEDVGSLQDESHAATTSLLHTWRPPMLSVSLKIALLLILAAFIAAIEILIRRSERNNGLGDLTSSRLEHYGWIYAAPTMLFLLGLSIGSLDFAVRVTELYRRLAKQPQPARALLFNPVFAGELTIIPRSLTHGLFLVALTAFTAMLLPISKIVIAGVCATGEMDAHSVLDVRLASQFSHVYNGSTTVGMWSFIRDPELNLTRPTWTNDAYAVGSIVIPRDLGIRQLSARLPVGYGALENCEAVHTYISDSLPEDINGVMTTLTFDNYTLCSTVMLDELDPRTAYFGRVWQDGGVQLEETETAGCAKQFHFVFGATPRGDPGYDHTLPVVHIACDATLTISTMIVTLATTGDNPVILDIDESSEQNRVDIPFDNYTQFLTGSQTLPTPFNADLDPTLAGFLVGNSTTLEEILDADVFKSILTSGWRDLWALHLDQRMRILAETTTPATRTYSVTRLIIVKVPARILEGILGAILIIVTVACVLTPIGSVLPKSPLSVAAQMSLVANSRLLRRVSEGATLDGVLIRLGWWRDPKVDGWKRYGIDIVDENEESFPLTKM